MINKELFCLVILSNVFVVLCFPAPALDTQHENDEDHVGVRKSSEDTIEEIGQKSKLAAFLLSFFLGGFGADWFYLSRGVASYIIVGIVKMLLLISQVRCSYTTEEGSELECGLEINCFGRYGRLVRFCSIFIWWVVDWMRILDNNFPDGIGMKLMLF